MAYCNACYNNPCTCRAVTLVPSACTTGECSPTIAIQDLLDLIDSKCDKETCKYLQSEITYIYYLLGVEKPPVDGTPPVLSPLGFQLISNMVDSLKGDLKDKYPSAELLKQQLTALWKCLADKHTHHGEWKDNFTWRNVDQLTDEMCLLDGGQDFAPNKIKVITPIDVGSTVFHTIDGRRCLFESLVDNNVTEPSKLNVLKGKWLNYCDIKDVINCVLPRSIITDCKANCDDPNGDGVAELPTLCERVHSIEGCAICTVTDTNSVDLTKTSDNLKADVRISSTPNNGVSVKPDGLFANTIVDFKLANKPGGNGKEYVITDASGRQFKADCCQSAPFMMDISQASHEFTEFHRPSTPGPEKYLRPGQMVIPANAPRAKYQVFSSCNMGTTNGNAAPTSSFMGYNIVVNGIDIGRNFWSNDEDYVQQGTTSDHVATGYEILTLAPGDIIQMSVLYGDHGAGNGSDGFRFTGYNKNDPGVAGAWISILGIPGTET